ncbi:molybdopterin-binding protein [Oxalobacteraceae bacterium OM1]|nr:molybdopterin-binding protein [Oxalobacteraceae bacterium OM1]
MKRRTVLGAAGALLLSACDRLAGTRWFSGMLESGETLSRTAHKVVLTRRSMAQEFREEDLSPVFRSNGTSDPGTPAYRALAARGFETWRLNVAGLVERPLSFSLADLRAMPAREQITRHDCVEGWSAIGKWRGTPLSEVLMRAQPHPAARYVVFHCADPMEGDRQFYYESIDLDDAFHPQTILAYDLNDKPLPVANGAPVRLRVERQLGYKHAKYLMRIELVEDFAGVRGGKGGYWEDSNGYQWYAGI